MTTGTSDFDSGTTMITAFSRRVVVAPPWKWSMGAGAPAGLLVAFAGAVVVRTAIAGPAGARSVAGSLTFATVLALIAIACRARPGFSVRIVMIGVGVAALLALPAVLHLGIRASLPVGDFPAWAV